MSAREIDPKALLSAVGGGIAEASAPFSGKEVDARMFAYKEPVARIVRALAEPVIVARVVSPAQFVQPGASTRTFRGFPEPLTARKTGVEPCCDECAKPGGVPCGAESRMVPQSLAKNRIIPRSDLSPAQVQALRDTSRTSLWALRPPPATLLGFDDPRPKPSRGGGFSDALDWGTPSYLVDAAGTGSPPGSACTSGEPAHIEAFTLEQIVCIRGVEATLPNYFLSASAYDCNPPVTDCRTIFPPGRDREPNIDWAHARVECNNRYGYVLQWNTMWKMAFQQRFSQSCFPLFDLGFAADPAGVVAQLGADLANSTYESATALGPVCGSTGYQGVFGYYPVELRFGYWSCSCVAPQNLVRDPEFHGALLWAAALLERFVEAIAGGEARAVTLLDCWYESVYVPVPSTPELRMAVSAFLGVVDDPPPVYRITNDCQFDLLPRSVAAPVARQARRAYGGGLVGWTSDLCCCFLFDPALLNEARRWSTNESRPFSGTYYRNEQVTAAVHELLHYALGSWLDPITEHVLIYNLWGAAGAWDRWNPHSRWRVNTRSLSDARITEPFADGTVVDLRLHDVEVACL